MTFDTSLRGKWGRFSRKVATTRREEGTGAAAKLAARWTTQFLHTQLSDARNRIYDARTGLDTIPDDPHMEFPGDVAYGDGVYYAPISPRVFPKVMKDLPISPKEYTFIDLGCGKGAAILLALTHGFRSAVGVEFNGRLVPIARANVEKFRETRKELGTAHVIEGDAAHFQFPDAPTVLYLYNPFGAETLQAVVDNLAVSLRTHPRDVLVAYVSPWHRSVLDQCPSFTPLPTRSHRWAIYRSTPVDA